jgi:E3 ubiquitin-protein ligase ATL23
VELRHLGGVCVQESAGMNSVGMKEEDETLCPICLDTMEPGLPVRMLPGCNRAFHKDCVDRWLAISCALPYLRRVDCAAAANDLTAISQDCVIFLRRS